MRPSQGFVVLSICLLVVGSAGYVAAGRPALFVATNGFDSATCGDQESPCRSISQAISNAVAGSRIIVGPGRYGDVNRNGVLGELGEESTRAAGMIDVDKAVEVISSDGALATVVDATGAVANAFFIAADRVVLGRPGHGFLITGAGSNGVGSGSSVSGTTISGNVAVANSQAGIVVAGARHVVEFNVSSVNGAGGFAVFGSDSIARNNVASGNGSEGFVMVGSGHVVRHNVANGNGYGFGVQGVDIEVRSNSALGNKFGGVYLLPGATATIVHNNIYGNNATPLNGQLNCGIENRSGNVIDATRNFWGSPGGPGIDPADQAGPGSGCDYGTSVTVIVPFARRDVEP